MWAVVLYICLLWFSVVLLRYCFPAVSSILFINKPYAKYCWPIFCLSLSSGLVVVKKVLPSLLCSAGQCCGPFLLPSVKHQLSWWDCRYGVRASHRVPVYSPAFIGTCCTCRGGMARLSWQGQPVTGWDVIFMYSIMSDVEQLCRLRWTLMRLKHKVTVVLHIVPVSIVHYFQCMFDCFRLFHVLV